MTETSNPVRAFVEAVERFQIAADGFTKAEDAQNAAKDAVRDARYDAGLSYATDGPSFALGYRAGEQAQLPAAPSVVRALSSTEIDRLLGDSNIRTTDIQADLTYGGATTFNAKLHELLGARTMPVIDAARVDKLFASLGKAIPVLEQYADHIDGEFANARRELRTLFDRLQRETPSRGVAP